MNWSVNNEVGPIGDQNKTMDQSYVVVKKKSDVVADMRGHEGPTR